MQQLDGRMEIRVTKKIDKGELTVEATIVMIAVMCMVFFIMNIGFEVYHMQMASSEANRAASDVAAIYGQSYKEPFIGYMKRDYFKEIDPYRYWGNKQKQKNIEKARWYTCYFLSTGEMGREKNTIYSNGDGKPAYTDERNSLTGTGYYPNVKVDVDENSIGQREIVVHVELTYPVLTLNPLVAFKFDPYYTVEGIGKAVCLDPLHDLNCTKLYSEIYTKIAGFSATTTIVSNIGTMIANIQSIINTLKK